MLLLVFLAAATLRLLILGTPLLLRVFLAALLRTVLIRPTPADLLVLRLALLGLLYRGAAGARDSPVS